MFSFKNSILISFIQILNKISKDFERFNYEEKII